MTTPEQHRQNEAVKAKICEAVPTVLCKYQHGAFGLPPVYNDITLEDVLVTMNKSDEWRELSISFGGDDGTIFLHWQNNDDVQWILNVPYDDQPQGTKDFLASVFLPK